MGFSQTNHTGEACTRRSARLSKMLLKQFRKGELKLNHKLFLNVAVALAVNYRTQLLLPLEVYFQQQSYENRNSATKIFI